MTIALFVLTAIVAVGDWYAVARQLHSMERVAKPLTLVLLIAATASADLGSAKGWVLAALVLSLVGDVALLFASDQASADELDPAFLVGLGAFLLGHLAYFGAFAAHGIHGWQAVAGVLVAGGAAGLAMPRVVRGAAASGGSQLGWIVVAYAAALATMVALAFGTGAVATAVGGLVFLASDTTLAWGRFVQPLQRGPVIVIVTYHVAQLLIVAGLVR